MGDKKEARVERLATRPHGLSGKSPQAKIQASDDKPPLRSRDGTAAYGSDGVLLGANVLDAFSRGIRGGNATHELIHQWVSYTNTSLGLSDGTAHYEARSSAASLVGGFQWVDNGDDTFTLNCDEGQNGAFHAPPIDKYMMGLIDGSDVPPLHVNDNINFAADCGGTIQSLLDMTIEDIQGVHGTRNPGPADAQHGFRIAFIAESHDRLLNLTELTYYNILAEHFTSPVPPEETALCRSPLPVGRFRHITSCTDDFHLRNSL